jgi:hypothetical protein
MMTRSRLHLFGVANFVTAVTRTSTAHAETNLAKPHATLPSNAMFVTSSILRTRRLAKFVPLFGQQQLEQKRQKPISLFGLFRSGSVLAVVNLSTMFPLPVSRRAFDVKNVVE